MMRPSFPRSGFAYILALTVILIVTLVALVLCRGVTGRMRAGHAALARTQCEQAALGMIRAVAHDLETSRKNGTLPALATVHAEGETIGDCVVMLIGRDPAEAKVSFGLIPESAKLDVNIAPVETLAALPGMTTAVAAAIADWRDADDDVNENGGAERTDYAGASPPYAPRNAPLESLDELRLVRGMTDAVYFGEDANQNGILDPGEDADGDGKLTPGLRDLLNLDAREPALAPDGTARTSVVPVGRALRTRLTDLLGATRGEEVYTAAQKSGPFSSRLEFFDAVLTEDEAAKVWPYLSGPEGRVGLLESWSSREDVLRAAVGDAKAQAIIAARPSVATASPLWLVRVVGGMPADDKDNSVTWHMLTTGSYQFTLDVLAVRKDGAGYARIQALIDLSGTTARVVSIRPAEGQGWPLTWITPEQLRRNPSGSDAAMLLSTIPR